MPSFEITGIFKIIVVIANIFTSNCPPHNPAVHALSEFAECAKSPTAPGLFDTSKL